MLGHEYGVHNFSHQQCRTDTAYGPHRMIAQSRDFFWGANTFSNGTNSTRDAVTA